MELVFEKQGHATKPKVTIGLCVRNCESMVGRAIKSVLNQDFPHKLMELIVVDDGSIDGTLKVVLGLVSKVDMPVKVFHGEWQGIGPVRNVVVNNAQGDYIVWVDGDMVLPKNHIKTQVEFMEKNPTVGIAKAKHRFLPEENIIAFFEHVPYMVYDAHPEILNSKLPGTGGAIYRVSAIKQVKGFDNRLKYPGEDQDAAYRIKKARWLIAQSPAFFYETRVETWSKLLKKYIWYGYGNYYLFVKNRKIFSLYRMNPIAGFAAGIIYGFEAYRLTKRKKLIFLPFHFTLKLMAWLFGFTKAHVKYLLEKRVNDKDKSSNSWIFK